MHRHVSSRGMAKSQKMAKKYLKITTLRHVYENIHTTISILFLQLESPRMSPRAQSPRARKRSDRGGSNSSSIGLGVNDNPETLVPDTSASPSPKPDTKKVSSKLYSSKCNEDLRPFIVFIIKTIAGYYFFGVCDLRG